MIIHSVKEGATESIEGINEIIRTTGSEATRFIGFNNQPMIYSLDPGYVLYETNGETVFKLKGSSLSKGEIAMEFGQNKCELLNRTQINVGFKCANTILNKNEWQKGVMSIRIDEPWYKFFKSDQTYTYPISIKSISNKIGEIGLEYFVEDTTKTRERRQEAQQREVRASKCSSNSVTWTFSPQSDCKIDVTSVKVNQGAKSRSSSYEGPNVNENGFTIVGHARGSGNRHLSFCDGGRGVIQVHPEWYEICETKTSSSHSYFGENDVNTLSWGIDRSFQLPEETTGFNLVVTQVNGQVKSISNVSETTDWFSTQYDHNSKVLIIKPKNVRDVLFD